MNRLQRKIRELLEKIAEVIIFRPRDATYSLYLDYFWLLALPVLASSLLNIFIRGLSWSFKPPSLPEIHIFDIPALLLYLPYQVMNFPGQTSKLALNDILKAIVDVNGVMIGFSGVLIAFFLRELRSSYSKWLLSVPVLVLVADFTFILSIMSCLVSMSQVASIMDTNVESSYVAGPIGYLVVGILVLIFSSILAAIAPPRPTRPW